MDNANTPNGYLSGLQANIEPAALEAVSGQLDQRSHSIELSLQVGTLEVQSPKPQLNARPYQKPILSKHLERINNQREHCQKELENLQQDFSKLGELERQLRLNRLEAKRQQRQLEQQHQQQFIVQAKSNVDRWRDEKAEIQQRKRQERERHLEIEQKEKRQREESEKKREEQRRKQKLKELEQFQKILETRRKKRQQIQKKAVNRHHEIPKYVELMERFKSQQEEYQFQLQVLKKKQKSQKCISFSKINEHQKVYLEEVRKKSVNLKLVKHSSQFKIFHNEEEKSEQKQRRKRRQNYQSLLKKIPINIDDQKKLEAQIIQDKAHNPLKYNFLRQKGLNDFQIFAEFKDFHVENQHKKLGDEYLTEQKQRHKQKLQNKRVFSESKVITENQSHYKSQTPTASKPTPRYPNYLPSLSLKRLDEIQTVVRNKKDKSTKIEILIQKSQQLQTEALKKIQKMHSHSTHNYKESIKNEDDVDKLYLQSLKAKLACAELAL